MLHNGKTLTRLLTLRIFLEIYKDLDKIIDDNFKYNESKYFRSDVIVKYRACYRYSYNNFDTGCSVTMSTHEVENKTFQQVRNWTNHIWWGYKLDQPYLVGL